VTIDLSLHHLQTETCSEKNQTWICLVVVIIIIIIIVMMMVMMVMTMMMMILMMIVMMIVIVMMMIMMMMMMMTLACSLEYGVDEIEIHTDAFEPGSKVLLVDDVLATGGTLVAAIELVKQAGGIVTDIAVLSEITFLGGRARIAEQSPDVSIHALISG
jgi:adenine phosphoribosyltransferase